MSISSFFERLVAGRWVAGTSAEEAIERTRVLNKVGIKAILNNLGEAFVDKKDVNESVNEYLGLISLIKKENVKADIALKLTEIGLLLGENVAIKNYSKIVQNAKKNKIFIWIDMEEAEYIDVTVEIYEMFIKSGNTGICIQSYMKRSINDVKKIVKKNGVIRLVKGAYSESKAVAYENREETTKNYLDLMEYLFGNAKSFTLGTHDAAMVELALVMNKKYKRDVTYAMLNGIRNDYALRLAKAGHKVSIYVPYGKRWFSYSYRRLKEATHLNLIIRSLFEKGI